MITFDFNTKNGNRVYLMEEPTPAQSAIIGITLIASFGILAGLMYMSIKLGHWLGKFINPGLGNGLGFLLLIIVLIVGGLAVAAAFQYIRFKVLTCYGFFTVQKDHVLEIHKKWNVEIEKEVDLETYNQVISTKTPGGYQIVLSTNDNKKLDIVSVLAPYNNIIPLSQDAKTPKTIKTGRHSYTKRPKQYPTDELLASWLEIDLIRDGQKVDFNRSVHIF